jgi:hypothetical protein
MISEDFETTPQAWKLQELIITGCGVVILALGLIMVLRISSTVWDLFSNHEIVLSMAKEVERHSNLNDVIQRMVKPFLPTSSKDGDVLLDLNLTYFAAWILTVLLLGLLGHVASLLLGAGCKLIAVGKKQPQAVTRDDLKTLLKDLVSELESTKQK